MQNKGPVIEIGNTWLITAFGMRQGVSTYELVLFASTDSGANWIRRATVAPFVSGQATSMGNEGPSESDMIMLDNGDLLAVSRTGQTFPNCDLNLVNPSIFWSISIDSGFNWSAPKMLGVAGEYPFLHRLSDGTIAMTYGRPGGKIIFVDPTGRRWSEPVVIHDGPGCGYVGLQQANDGKCVFIYTHSSWYNTSYDPGYYNTSWTPMDFDDGVEVEFRAREASGTTLQSGAVVQAADGTGLIAVELTHAGVNLEGAGGNASQETYSFDTSQWTTYRLTVAPDPDYGWQIRAKLYINGTYIFSNSINTDLSHDFVRIGDVTGTNNGTWDLDWLRFRALGQTEWAFEYEGDIIPTNLEEAWALTNILGSSYIVDSGGLDYLRIDTGNNGINRSLYYTLMTGSGQQPPDCYVYTENGQEIAYMKAAILDIVPITNIEEFDWALEYHGDATPDNLAEPWTRSQSGTVYKYLWADNGQDYLHFDTGTDGASKLLYYTLTGGPWNLMDFASGVATEFRARVVGPTNTGAAKILLGDAINGYTVVKLTDSGVNLKGVSQLTYSLDTSDWHTYRVVIGPDPTNGNDLWAKLYLDEDHTTPILAIALDPDTRYDEISIGDMNTTNNGVWDLDFLRFASTPCGLQAYPRGDVTENCVVNIYDLADMINNWMVQDTPPLIGDLTGDNRVDLEDYAVIGDNWLDDRQP